MHALHDLVAHPDVFDEVRMEAENVLEAEGWTMPAMGKLQKVDNFLRESQRFTGITVGTHHTILVGYKIDLRHIYSASMFRKAMHDIRLGNGTLIPKGTIVMAAVAPMHHDEDI